jgi:hypothetical protein
VDGMDLVKFGKTGIPEEVIQALGHSSVQTFGDVDIDMNFQMALDPLFLITGQGLSSIRSKVLGKITGADDAQRAVQLGASDHKNYVQELNRVKEAEGTVALKLEKYINIDNIQASLMYGLSQLNEVENLSNILSKLNVYTGDLSSITLNARNAKSKIDIIVACRLDDQIIFLSNLMFQIGLFEETFNLHTQISKQKIISSIDISGIDVESMQKTLLDMNNFHRLNNEVTHIINNINILTPRALVVVASPQEIEELTSMEVSLKHYTEIQGYVSQIVFQIQKEERRAVVDIPDISEIISLWDSLVYLVNLSNEINIATQHIKLAEGNIHDSLNELNNSQNMLYLLEEELGMCPTCGNPFKREDKCV